MILDTPPINDSMKKKALHMILDTPVITVKPKNIP